MDKWTEEMKKQRINDTINAVYDPMKTLEGLIGKKIGTDVTEEQLEEICFPTKFYILRKNSGWKKGPGFHIETDYDKVILNFSLKYV